MNVEVTELCRHFGGTKAVDGISFSFAAGHVFGFVGPNGAGKTTTMRIMATLDEPTSGDARVDGISVVQQPERVRRLLGYVPDFLPTLAGMSVHEYLDFFARAYGLAGAVRRKAVTEIEEFTGVAPIREKLLQALSRGMKQRVSLGRALIHDPRLLILDEPAAGLDPRARVELRELLAALAGQDRAVFISSHILSELREICDGVVIIEQGRILATGSMDEVITRSAPKRTLIIRAIERQSPLRRELLEMPHVEAVRASGTELFVEIDGSEQVAAELLAQIIARGYRIAEFSQRRAGLEDVFMSVTKGGVQ